MFRIANREYAVSPVIGTILLVAITVVLVAIIGAVVMNLADAEDGKKVGLNAHPASGPDAKLILYGGESLSDLVKLEMIDQGSSKGEYVTLWDINENNPLFVGNPYLAVDVARPEKPSEMYETRINVKGTFTDGREIILLVQPMTFTNVFGKYSDYVTSTSFGGPNGIITAPSGSTISSKYMSAQGGNNFDYGESPAISKYGGAYINSNPKITTAANPPQPVEYYKVVVQSLNTPLKENSGYPMYREGTYTKYQAAGTNPMGKIYSGGTKHGLTPTVGPWQATVYVYGENDRLLAHSTWKIVWED